MMMHPDFVTDIKEEIIEWNKEKMVITRYVVVIERALNTLGDIRKTWMNPEKADKK